MALTRKAMHLSEFLPSSVLTEYRLTEAPFNPSLPEATGVRYWLTSPGLSGNIADAVLGSPAMHPPGWTK